VYDGNTNLLSAALVPTGAMADDALQAAFTSGNFAGKDAGSQNFNLSGLALQGADQANYVLGNAQFSGTGTITHLASAMMSAQTGVQTQHIPYKGSAPGLVDLAAGQTQFMIDTINTVLPYVRDNRLRGLAVTSIKRSTLLPDLPTLAESGMPGFDAAAWQGIVVPTSTPADIVQKLNAEVNKALAHPDLRARLAAQGAEILGGTPAEYAAHLRTEMPRWAKAVKDSGAKAE